MDAFIRGWLQEDGFPSEGFYQTSVLKGSDTLGSGFMVHG